MEKQSIIDHFYSIEKLPEIFAEHALIASKESERLLKMYIENNPNQPIPEYLQESFNIALALRVMCQAIKDLQEKS